MRRPRAGIALFLALGFLLGPIGINLHAEEEAVPETPSLAAELAAYIHSRQNPSTGLPVSFFGSGDALLENITFTYDAALASLVMAHAGDSASAEKTLGFFRQSPLPAADTYDFNTTYNAGQGHPSLEYRVHGGPIFWMVIAMLREAEATGQPDLQARALQLLDWARTTLPHSDGGIAMSQRDSLSGIFSTENVWVYYAALRIAAQQLPDGEERRSLDEERHRVRAWLGRIGTNRGFRLPDFVDPVQALDVYTHPLLVGPESHLEDGAFGSPGALSVWAKAHIEALEMRFKVPDSSLYNYTDEVEAKAIGRSRAGWLEGTEQVVVAYRTWADWFAGQGDSEYAGYLNALANASHAAVKHFKLTYADGAAIPNTDAPIAFRTFQDGWRARPSTEPALNGTTWTYFGEVGYNPFVMPLSHRAAHQDTQDL